MAVAISPVLPFYTFVLVKIFFFLVLLDIVYDPLKDHVLQQSQPQKG